MIEQTEHHHSIIFTQNKSMSLDDRSNRIINILSACGRKNIENVINWMTSHGFFEAPASVIHHNNFRGGLAKHSLEVYEQANVFNETFRLTQESVTICALLHDICKSDQFYITSDNKPACRHNKQHLGHGIYSVSILRKECQLPLSHEEEMAIWWHMGKHEASKDNFEKEYQESKSIELCKLIQLADLTASRVATSNKAQS